MIKIVQMSLKNRQNSFWETKTLAEMNNDEWENLCDGCARCCLMKIQDEETEEIAFTSVACKMLDCSSCQCKDYTNRALEVPDCVQLTLEEVQTLPWLPQTCAYRLINEGKPLYPWHHLISGSRNTVHEAGISVRGKVTLSESELTELHDLEDHVVEWPNEA